MIQIVKVKPTMGEMVYHSAAKFIDSACSYSNGEVTSDNVFKQVSGGECNLVLVYRDDEIIAALTVEVRTCPSGKRLLAVTNAGGSHMDEWIDEFKENVRQWAIDSNCQDVYIIGRPGWEKMLKQFNFKKAHIVMSCSIEDMS